jgi:dethiobiotin synthetase
MKERMNEAAMRRRGVFVTGTDTGAGKTWVAAGLLAALNARGIRATGMKPVSCGCEIRPGGLRNEDALLLQSCSADPAPAYETINRYAFAPPVAPHLAARMAGQRIDVGLVRDDLRRLAAQTDYVVVEGAGGWLVPLNEEETIADLARALGLPVVLVVGMRLGCLNHALLGSAAIIAAGLPLVGWVAAPIDPAMALAEENIAALQARIPAPLLGRIPQLPAWDAGRIGESLDIEALLRADGN